MNRGVSRGSLYSCALLALCLVVPFGIETALADEPTVAAAPVAKNDARVELGENGVFAPVGLVAFHDPVTGELTSPTPEQLAAVHAEIAAWFDPDGMNWSSEGLEEVVLPNGAVMIDLKGRFRTGVVLTTSPDGTSKPMCVDHIHPSPLAAEHALETVPAKPEAKPPRVAVD